MVAFGALAAKRRAVAAPMPLDPPVMRILSEGGMMRDWTAVKNNQPTRFIFGVVVFLQALQCHAMYMVTDLPNQITTRSPMPKFVEEILFREEQSKGEPSGLGVARNGPSRVDLENISSLHPTNPRTANSESQIGLLKSLFAMASEASEWVTLVSDDGFQFVIRREIAIRAGTLRRMLDQTGKPSCRRRRSHID
jgi:hypothetical protein